MKYIVVLFAVGYLFAGVKIADPAQYGHDVAYLDSEQMCRLPHRTLPCFRGNIVLVDSTSGITTAWTKMHECLAFNPHMNGLEFVSRGYSPSGILNVHQTDNAFSFWIDYNSVYNMQIPPANGGARYPTSVAANSEGGPLISFPTLGAGPVFGHAVAMYQEGWYSGFWTDPVDIGSGDIGAHKVIGKQLPDGNILFIVCNVSNDILFFTWSSDLQTQIASGVIADGVNYFGFDINSGIAYVSYYDDALNVFYKTSTDGVNWSSEQSYNMQWALPYTNNTLFWTQMALTDAGDPLLVYDMIDGDDATYPWNGVVAVSYQEGVPSVVVSQSDSQAFWGTIATGGNYAVVLYQLPWNSGVDSFAAHDQWFNWSSDNGITWNTPVKITNSDEYTGLAQLAKRVDAVNGNFFFFYCVHLAHEYDPWFMASVSGVGPLALYVGRQEIDVGVEENCLDAVQEISLNIYPNPFSTYTMIKVAGQNAQGVGRRAEGKGQSAKGEEIQIYDATGRVVKHFNLQSQISNPQCIPWSGTDNNGNALPAGVYFVCCETGAKPLVEEVVKLR